MQSLDQLPHDGARALLGVCFDVDDTVTTHGTLDAAAYQALFALRAAGLKLIAVTGRPLGFAEVIARMWPVDAAVGENGAGFIARVGTSLRVSYWDSFEQRSSQQQKLVAIRARVARELPEVAVSSDAWARRCDLAFDIAEQAALPPDVVDRLVALLEDAGAHASVSSIHAHAQLGEHDKARGVLKAASELWGMSAEVVQHGFMFVGDSGNDAAGFGWFTLTAGVANLTKHLARLPTPPRFLATREYGAGFAEIAEALLRARASRT